MNDEELNLELHTNTMLNPDFGMNDGGFIMHVKDYQSAIEEQ
ncbi:hypothetical protein [Pontibacillus litoralis]|uniref:Uncharacterized protein n=1 Tax=Pontibacillus litoralis JSM 072002 TaxID=1385512 RepID=A0A0A5FVG7_9BACI|nr:hypothetical protein [Pontibacillus litoralis]KGX84801.1 hypothetical protein N784_11950 [Pontibacillus litoralis JSM 072002]